MALIKCRECNHEISKTAKTCPNCGAQNKKRTSAATKFFVLIVGLYFVVVILEDFLSQFPGDPAPSTYTPPPVSTSTKRNLTSSESAVVTEQALDQIRAYISEGRFGSAIATAEKFDLSENPEMRQLHTEATEMLTAKKQETADTQAAEQATAAAKRATASKNAWSYRQSEDQMSGKVTGYLISYSQNTLVGWLRNGKILFGYNCEQGFYLKANDLGFATDDIECSEYGCDNEHYSRIKFDDGVPQIVAFSVWDDNNDGMSLHRGFFDSQAKADAYFLRNMKAGKKMFVEIELFGTDGREQIAQFNLTGFTKAYNQCR